MFVNNLLIVLPVLTLLNTVESNDKFGQMDILRHPNANFNQSLKSELKARHRRDNEDDAEIGWSIINEEVDTVIPLLLEHLQKLQIEHLQLPDIKENLSVKPLFLTYEAGLYLTNGIVYNVAGIQRYGPAYMTYEDKSFLTRFYLNIKNLQFEYNFLLKLMALEGFGKVIGSLEDVVIYAELAVDILTFKMKLYDFRVIQFRNIQVQLDQTRFIRHLTGVILSPITNLFKDRITTSISDGLKDQMQMVMDDFNNEDPLELKNFVKQILGGLTGQKN
ncbi:uncharacterized protein LOC119604476 isoform X1 [Lucilia sericata]|uniref:uncharacterized protein LOC119604476 isoform X1 n=2 Tax=Lucilia sericata TaxID=13632 RepID=UPI0018A81DA5|nr:uncharacterized protein LOC119604476 isoform X1 [Lucilia sericata]XP_037813058.1 uncharacterized protein LOC119604476 isoform X1 [Lucilia sericata]